MNPQVQKRPNIPLVACTSSQINAHGFDPATGILAVQFKAKNGPGNTYHYPNCTPELYGEFCGAESLGKFFGQRIRNNKDMPAVKLEPEHPAHDIQ